MDGSAGFKVVTLGDGGVGKTSLIMRYVYGVFSGVQQTTIGSSFVERDVTVADATYKLRLWDTAGQERFDALTGFYARGARAVVICYDMTDRDTFEKVTTRWVKKVEDDVQQGACHLCIVGTKADLVRDHPSRAAVSAQDVSDLKAELGHLCPPSNPADFFETSAKDDLGVAAIFECVAQRFHNQETSTPADAAGSVTLGGATPKKQNGCCPQ